MFFNRHDSGNIYPRKKKINPLAVIFIALLLLFVLAYIIYAINIPEPQPFSNIDPVSTISQSGYGESLENTPYSVETSPAASAASGGSGSAYALAADNPIMDVLQLFDDRWGYSYQTMEYASQGKDLSYAFPVMDIAHGDIFRDAAQLANLSISSAAAESTETGMDQAASAQIAPVSGASDLYEFRVLGKDHLPITGRVNVVDQSLYFVEEDESGRSKRFFELVWNDDSIYAQLMTSDGPYAGILYFALSANGDLRCSYLSAQQFQEQGAEITRYFSSPPESWEAFTGSATAYFSAIREEVSLDNGQEGAGAGNEAESTPSSSSTASGSSSSSSGGARIAASTPAPPAETQAAQDLPEENEDIAELPEEGTAPDREDDALPEEGGAENLEEIGGEEGDMASPDEEA